MTVKRTSAMMPSAAMANEVKILKRRRPDASMSALALFDDDVDRFAIGALRAVRIAAAPRQDAAFHQRQRFRVRAARERVLRRRRLRQGRRPAGTAAFARCL